MGRRRTQAVAAAAASCLELASLDIREGWESSDSVRSAFSYQDGDVDDVRVDEFEKNLDALFEKRGSTREKALASLAVMLRVDYREPDCQSHNETLTRRCLLSLKRGSAIESSLASQLLGLHMLTLGQPNDSLFNTVRPELERAASGAHGGGGAVQVAAMDSLALAAFVLAEDEQCTRSVMERLRAMWSKAGDAKARSAAVRGWSFLLTSLSGDVHDHEAMSYLTALAGLMDERDLELRKAAGEAVAVLRTSCSAGVLKMLENGVIEEEGEDGEEEEEEGNGCIYSGSNRQSKVDSAGERELERVMERMQELATNKGDKLRRSRRDRASQRSTFRGLLEAMSGEVLPSCRIKLQHGDSLTVDGVGANHQLAFLRRFLAGGFQAHLQRNPLLHDVFGFQPRSEKAERMSAVEKRMARSANSAGARACTAEQQWSRDAKAYRLNFGN